MPKRRGRGEGGIEELASGKFRATRSDRGVRERKVHDSKKSAVEWLRQVASEARGEWAMKPLAEWLDHWLQAKKPTVQPATYHWYAVRVKRMIKPELGAVRLGDLSGVRVQAWINKMLEAGDSPHKRQGALKTLRAALADAIRMDQLSKNAALAVKLPKVTKEKMRCLDESEAVRLLQAARSDRFAAFYDLAIDAGMRPGELFALHWSCVRGDVVVVERSLESVAGVTRLKEPKTAGGVRRIPIAPRTVEALRRHRLAMQAEGWDVEFGPVFVGERGALIDPRRLRQDSFRPILAASGLPCVRLYDLRHTSATLLLARDVNVKVVSERLGHSDIATTLRHYAHALPRMQERAVSAVQSIFGDLPTADPSATEHCAISA